MENGFFSVSIFSKKDFVEFAYKQKIEEVLLWRPTALSGRPLPFLLSIFLLSSMVHSAPRDIQIRAVDFERQVVVLTNYGIGTQSLSGFRFCSHDANNIRQYSNSGGLNSVSLASGESLYIHFNNDASQSNEINIAVIGGNFATPLTTEAYGLQLYFPPVVFGNGFTIADHLQWSWLGEDNMSADERSHEAEGGGVWLDQTEWIPTVPQTQQILLTDLSGAVLHSPANYLANPAPDEVAIPLMGNPFSVALFMGLLGVGVWQRHSFYSIFRGMFQ